MVSSKKNAVIIFTFLSVLCVAGCDNIAPKAKKAAAVPATVTAPAAPVAAAAAVTSADEKLSKDVLAKVGDWTLSVAEFNERVKNIKQVVPNFDEKNVEAKKTLIDELIRQQLMVHEARDQKFNESKEFVAAMKDFENNILVQELVTDMTKDIKVTDAEAKDYYDKNPDVFLKPVEKKVSEIMVLTEAEAKDVLVSALQGTDFAQLAKDRSKSKSAANGGDLGFITKPAFEQMGKAIETLNKGGVSSVFQGPDGFYIVKVDDVRGGDKVAFDEVKADLIKGLTSQKQQQVVLGKMAEVAKKVKVTVNTDLLDGKTGE
ncbi:MAG: peptidyl-prolyl cis-trans isomerase [Candidatus Omnitrophica bacterium]|nr:peptidyl-prolyl cis-trans isomerase [Candidatus Omnitrophota bacterium]